MTNNTISADQKALIKLGNKIITERRAFQRKKKPLIGIIIALLIGAGVIAAGYFFLINGILL